MAARLTALFLLAFSLLPVANLLPGGEEDPAYWARLSDWGLGTLLCVGVGALVWYVTRRRPVSAPPASTDEGTRDLGFQLAVAAMACGLYVAVALGVFNGRPLLIDEIVHVLQARDYAAGVLSQPLREPREFFSIMHVVDLGDRVYGQYPAGGPAMLVPFVWLGREWLAGPVFGAACVLLFAALLAAVEPDATRRFRRGTLLVFAVAPFGVFMFGSHMNHATTLAWVLVACVGLARATRDGASPVWGLITGLGLGIAATIRPLDAVAFALPAAGWLLWRARHGGRALATLLLSGVGVALPMSLMFWVNLQTTGQAFRFGYDELWGAGHALGFHQAAWGPVHTPRRGLELVSLYLTRLSSYLFETPFPALVFPAFGLWRAERLSALDRYLLASGALVLCGYWAYWHDGFYLGPRFVFALLPLVVLWTARGVRSLAQLLGPTTARWRGAQAAIAVGAAYAAVTLATVRVPTYQNGMRSMRIVPEEEAARAGVRDAIVLVQESWGAQLIVRLWAAGVPRSETELLYRSIDACQLETALDSLERAGADGDAVLTRLTPLTADSARLVPSDISPDFTERLLPGSSYAGRCAQRIAEDRSGYLLYAPWRLARDSNIYARWLPGREREVLETFPGRAVYRVRRAGTTVDAALVWDRLRVSPAESDTTATP